MPTAYDARMLTMLTNDLYFIGSRGVVTMQCSESNLLTNP